MATTYGGGGNGVTGNRGSVTDFEPVSEGSNDTSIDSLLYGTKWGGAIGASVSLYTSFSKLTSVYDYTDDDTAAMTPFLATQITGARKAMAAWAAVANISFVETTDSATNAGDIRWGQTNNTGTGTAHGALPSPWFAEGGDIWFGPNYPEKFNNPVLGTYGYHTYVHELGHALGLKHPHEGSVLAEMSEDQMKYSVMSYKSYEWDFTNAYSNEFFPTTPMLNDILAMQFLYGANLTYETGNNTYQWAADENVFETIWDAGGIDTIDAANQAESVILNLNPGDWSNIGVAFWNGQTNVRNCLTIAYGATIENATGSAYADFLFGNSVNNVLMGNGGNDTLSGDLGNDTLNGGAGADTMTGGDGSDIYYVDNALDIVTETNATAGTGGTDLVCDYIDAYTLGANLENGRILAAGAANLTGNSLNNLLYAGAGNNVINGGSGADTVSYLYASSAVTVSLAVAAAQATGGSGADTLTAIESLAGSNYNDRLTGNSGANTLSGGLGNDALNGGAGADTMTGGNGSDTYYLDNALDTVTETNATASTGGTDLVCDYLSAYTLGANVENGRILATGAANLIGNSLNNILYAGTGNNVLDGGTGADTVSYLYASSAVTVSLAVAAAQATGGSGTDTLTAIEYLIGSNYNDRLTGNNGNNLLVGGLGNDILNGSFGNDTMIGGNGSDTYYLDNALDIVTETNAAASTGGMDMVYSSLGSYTLDANLENGRILSVGAANLTGNSLNNLLYAGSGNNVINGGSGSDTVSYSYAGSAVTVNLAVAAAQVTGGSGSDTLSAIENLTGSNYGDTLTGNSGNNLLSGGLGNDLLNGGAGNDTLTGGTGADAFLFSTALSVALNKDTITDFVAIDDTIRLENAIFTRLATVGALSAANFRASATGTAADANDYLLYDTDSGALYYDADGNGAGAAVQFASLTGHPAITVGDFLVV